jgi:hypothetical protein
MSTRLALLLMLTGLCACANGSPNGKNEVLFILTPGAMSRHLENSILIPGHMTIYSGKMLEFPRTFSFDLSGTTLDIKAAEGIEILEKRLEKSQDGHLLWRVRIRCQTASGERTEFAVRVMDDKRARYEDAIDISCWEPEKLLATLPYLHGQPGKTPKTVLQGGDFIADVRLLGTVRDNPNETLSGTGVEVVDPQGPIRLVEQSPIWAEKFVFRAERLGKEPLLKAGPLTAPVPIEVVPNDGWSLRARTTFFGSSGGGGLLVFSGYAEHSDGGISAGLHEVCTFSMTPPVGKLEEDRHNECSGKVSDAPDAGEFCIEAFGQTGCSKY